MNHFYCLVQGWAKCSLRAKSGPSRYFVRPPKSFSTYSSCVWCKNVIFSSLIFNNVAQRAPKKFKWLADKQICPPLAKSLCGCLRFDFYRLKDPVWHFGIVRVSQAAKTLKWSLNSKALPELLEGHRATCAWKHRHGILWLPIRPSPWCNRQSCLGRNPYHRPSRWGWPDNSCELQLGFGSCWFHSKVGGSPSLRMELQSIPEFHR